MGEQFLLVAQVAFQVLFEDGDCLSDRWPHERLYYHNLLIIYLYYQI